jgi:hypothetical protein
VFNTLESSILPKAGPAVAVTLLAGKTTTASTGTAGPTAAATTATTLLLRLYAKSVWDDEVQILCKLTARSASTVAAGTGIAILKRCMPLAQGSLSTSHTEPASSRAAGMDIRSRTVVVGIVALLSAGLVALALNGGSGLDVRAVALAVPGSSLVDGLCRGLSWPVGVELRVVACGVVSEISRTVRFKSAYPATRTCSKSIVSCWSCIGSALSAPIEACTAARGCSGARARCELTLEAIVVILMV